MSELPKGWVTCTPSDLANDPKNEIVDGPFGSNLKASEYTDEGTPIVRIQNVKRMAFLNKNIKYVTDEKAEFLKRHSFKSGDLLITKLGEPLGLTCIAPEHLAEGIIVADIVRLRPNPEVNRKCLAYLLNSEGVIKQINAHTKGSTRARINLSVVRNLNINLPPLAEQKRIVEKLDEVLAQVDTIKARLDSIPDLLKRFRQSVLASAVSGKLTEEWRSQNVDKLLSYTQYKAAVDHFFELKKKTEQKRILKLKDQDWFYKPIGLPEGWVDARLIDITSVITCGVAKKPEYQDVGIRFLSAQNSKPFAPNLKGIRYITEKDFNTYTVGAKPEKGDVLYSRVGANFGEACVIPWDFDFAIYVSLTLLKPLRQLICGDYLTVFLNSQDGVLQSRGGIMGSGIQNLNVESVRKYRLGLPSIHEQKEIVRLVDQYFTFADTIEAQVKKAQARVDNLTQSILAKAFRGELVTQDPNDEPADKLLERIAEARKEAEALAKAAKKAEAAKKRAAKASGVSKAAENS